MAERAPAERRQPSRMEVIVTFLVCSMLWAFGPPVGHLTVARRALGALSEVEGKTTAQREAELNRQLAGALLMLGIPIGVVGRLDPVAGFGENDPTVCREVWSAPVVEWAGM